MPTSVNCSIVLIVIVVLLLLALIWSFSNSQQNVSVGQQQQVGNARYAATVPTQNSSVTFRANLSGSQQVPVVATNGSGNAEVVLDTTRNTITYSISWQGLSGPALAAHFHGPAAAGSNAGIILPLPGDNPQSPSMGQASLTAQQVQSLLSGQWYVNIHTSQNPNGEIRGQLVAAS